MTNSTTPALPPLPGHPEPHTMAWTKLELAAIESYALQAAADLTRQLDEARAEVARLTACLAGANSQAEHFEREWYLRGHALEDVTAEVERLRVDAERYRALRMWDWFDGPLCVVRDPKQAIYLGADCPSRERLDALIDAAQAAPAQKELT